MIKAAFLQAFASLLDRSVSRHQFLILFGIPRRRRLILLPFALSRLCVNAPSNCLTLQTVEYDFLFLTYYPSFIDTILSSFVLHIASLTIESDRLLHIVWSSILPHRSRFCSISYVTFFIIFHPRLYCGFEDAIELFDLSRPGEGTRLYTTPSKKSKDGLKGKIIILAYIFRSNLGSKGSSLPLHSHPHITPKNSSMLQEVFRLRLSTLLCLATNKNSLSRLSKVVLEQELRRQSLSHA